MTSKSDLDLEGADLVLHLTYHLIVVNISANSLQSPTRNDKVIEQTRKKEPIFDLLPASVTFTLEVQSCHLGMTHLLVGNISAKIFQNSPRNDKVMEQTRFNKK